MNRQVSLGILFVVALSILAYFTLFLGDLDLFGRKPTMLVQFPEANGLREGEAVMVVGMPYGRVKSLVYDGSTPEGQMVTAILALDREVALFEDYAILIEESSFLGGRQVNIWPGTQAAPGLDVRPDVALTGSIALSPLDSLGSIGTTLEDSEERIRSILANVDEIIADVRAGKGLVGRVLADETLASDTARGVKAIADTMEDASVITDDLRAGRGTVGRLLRDDTLADQATALLDEVNSLVDGVAAGEGTVGLLMKDPEVRANLATLVENLEAVSGQVTAGKGTLGRLVYGEEVADELETFLSSLNAEGGTLGAILHSRELYDQLSGVLTDVRAVSSALATGEGSLGRLIMEGDLYDEVMVSVRLLNRSLEDYREAAPISTFTSVLFSAF